MPGEVSSENGSNAGAHAYSRYGSVGGTKTTTTTGAESGQNGGNGSGGNWHKAGKRVHVASVYGTSTAAPYFRKGGFHCNSGKGFFANRGAPQRNFRAMHRRPDWRPRPNVEGEGGPRHGKGTPPLHHVHLHPLHGELVPYGTAESDSDYLEDPDSDFVGKAGKKTAKGRRQCKRSAKRYGGGDMQKESEERKEYHKRHYKISKRYNKRSSTQYKSLKPYNAKQRRRHDTDQFAVHGKRSFKGRWGKSTRKQHTSKRFHRKSYKTGRRTRKTWKGLRKRVHRRLVKKPIRRIKRYESSAGSSAGSESEGSSAPIPKAQPRPAAKKPKRVARKPDHKDSKKEAKRDKKIGKKEKKKRTSRGTIRRKQREIKKST